jgi:triphosphoribosyl-dephospho-CoA synthase
MSLDRCSNQPPIAYPFDRTWPIATAATLACLYEATAPKSGNVHPLAPFGDMTYNHFLQSAAAIGSVFDRAVLSHATASSDVSLGTLVLDAVVATRQAVGRNTNLGTLLLFGPLVKAWLDASPQNFRQFQQATASQLKKLTAVDAEAIYAAIRHAQPGGMGEATNHDISHKPPDCLVTAMREVAEFDAVARQYTNNFADVFELLLPWFEEELTATRDPFQAICDLQLRWLAREPDGLILRKSGADIAAQAQLLAADAANAKEPCTKRLRIQELDTFLRADGNRRNPGTTADMIAATLLVRLVCPQ